MGYNILIHNGEQLFTVDQKNFQFIEYASFYNCDYSDAITELKIEELKSECLYDIHIPAYMDEEYWTWHSAEEFLLELTNQDLNNSFILYQHDLLRDRVKWDSSNKVLQIIRDNKPVSFQYRIIEKDKIQSLQTNNNQFGLALSLNLLGLSTFSFDSKGEVVNQAFHTSSNIPKYRTIQDDINLKSYTYTIELSDTRLRIFQVIVKNNKTVSSFLIDDNINFKFIFSLSKEDGTNTDSQYIYNNYEIPSKLFFNTYKYSGANENYQDSWSSPIPTVSVATSMEDVGCCLSITCIKTTNQNTGKLEAKITFKVKDMKDSSTSNYTLTNTPSYVIKSVSESFLTI